MAVRDQNYVPSPELENHNADGTLQNEDSARPESADNQVSDSSHSPMQKPQGSASKVKKK